MNATAEALGTQVRNRRSLEMRDGTVVTVSAKYRDDERTFTYAAIWIAATRKWYLTGWKGIVMSNEAFFDWLASDEVVDIAVATAWEQVER